MWDDGKRSRCRTDESAPGKPWLGPCAFIYEPTKIWILAIFEGGATFYGSKDLIQWERLSNIRFGHECPDVYELPLDGNEDIMKWVLQDANGS